MAIEIHIISHGLKFLIRGLHIFVLLSRRREFVMQFRLGMIFLILNDVGEEKIGETIQERTFSWLRRSLSWMASCSCSNILSWDYRCRHHVVIIQKKMKCCALTTLYCKIRDFSSALVPPRAHSSLSCRATLCFWRFSISAFKEMHSASAVYARSLNIDPETEFSDGVAFCWNKISSLMSWHSISKESIISHLLELRTQHLEFLSQRQKLNYLLR